VASLPVYFLCEAEPPELRVTYRHSCDVCGWKWLSTRRTDRCPTCNRSGQTGVPLKQEESLYRRAALGGDAGGRRATLPAVPCLVRAARAEGENLHSLRGVLDTAFPEIGGPVRAAAHPALPSFPEPIETSA
jgi:hypothetical protein